MSQTVLLCGGCGFIGSHVCVTLLAAGHRVVIADDLSNSSLVALDRIKAISHKDVTFYKADLKDREATEKVFSENKDISVVIVLAGFKAVGESVQLPIEYYHNNINIVLNLVKVMEKFNVFNIVFSSSASVYGEPTKMPITECFPTQAASPYGRTKEFIEHILRDWAAAQKKASVVLLRYFNPVGAHPSGLIGENPKGTPMNLMPFVSQVAIGMRPKVFVFGNDYNTPDGTGVRDYIHIVDLAEGHLASFKAFATTGCKVYNLGLGRGYSVLEMIQAMRKATGKEIPFEITARRAGDVATCYSDCSKAEKDLGWKAKLGLDEMCADLWRWQSMNPEGFATKLQVQ